MVRQLLGASGVAALMLGCGGAARGSLGDPGAGAGGAAAGNGAGGNAAGQIGTGGARAGEGPGGTAGRAVDGGMSAGGASVAGDGGLGGGTGGAVGGGTGGAVPDPIRCADPYAGPSGGPRPDGPKALNGACSQIAEEVILGLYRDYDARVPRGLYFEPGGLVTWEEPCSDSPDDTLTRSIQRNLGTFEDAFTTDWFHETAWCDGALRRLYRNLRCDYFDGQRLPNGSAEDLAFLASVLWWQSHSNVSGSGILGYSVSIGAATDRVELCSIRTIFGDFGLCDEITLESTVHAIQVGGAVTLGEPQIVRTIQGRCN